MKKWAYFVLFTSSCLVLFIGPANSHAQLVFKKIFIPELVAPGEEGTIRFEISSVNPAETFTNMSFSENLNSISSGLINQTTNPQPTGCGTGVSITSSSTVSFSGGELLPDSVCTVDISFLVHSSTANGSYLTTTSALSADSAGVSISAPPVIDTLNVKPTPTMNMYFPGYGAAEGDILQTNFSISNLNSGFDADSVTMSGSMASFMTNLDFVGFTQTATCSSGFQIDSSFSYSFYIPTLPMGHVCYIYVQAQVKPDPPKMIQQASSGKLRGVLDGLNFELTSESQYELVPRLVLTKSFSKPTVVGGDSLSLDFSIINTSSTDSSNSFNFKDSVSRYLPGLNHTGPIQNDVCGVPGSLSGVGNLSIYSTSIGPGDTCRFSVPLLVPDPVSPGAYPNFTSSIMQGLHASSHAGSPAYDTLEVVPKLNVSKRFLNPEVIQGDTIQMELVINNGHTDSTAGSISFSDSLDVRLSGLHAVNLPLQDACGSGSSLTGSSLLTFTGGTLAPVTSCTLDLELSIPLDADSGTYTNTVTEVAGMYGTSPVAGNQASADFTVGPVLNFTKAFYGSPVTVNDTLTLTWYIKSNMMRDVMVTDIAFDYQTIGLKPDFDVLDVPQSAVCGDSSELAGTDTVSLSKAHLAQGDSCSISIKLEVNPSVTFSEWGSGTYQITAKVDGRDWTGPYAFADFMVIGPPVITAVFMQDSAMPEDTVTLNVKIENPNDILIPISDIGFEIQLDNTIPGCTTLSTPLSDFCGAGSQLTGSSHLVASNLSLAPEDSCAFSINLVIPDSAEAGPKTTTIDAISGLVEGLTLTGTAATASLIVGSYMTPTALPGFEGEYLLTNVLLEPFAARLQFGLQLAAGQHIKIDLRDIQGAVRVPLFEGRLESGNAHAFSIKTGHLRKGVYFLMIEGETFSIIRKVVLLR